MIDPTIDKYLQGKIYKLVSMQTDEIYIGCTARKLSQRFSCHKSSYKHNKNSTMAYKILKYDDVKIELIEAYPTTSKYFLELRERYWIEKINCVNKIIPTRSSKEYRTIHKERLTILHQHYERINKEKFKERKKKYRQHYERINKEKIKERKKKYRINNIEKFIIKYHQYQKEYLKKYREKHKEYLKEQALQYRLKNKIEISKRRKIIRDANKKVPERVECDKCKKNLSKSSLYRHTKLHCKY